MRDSRLAFMVAGVQKAGTTALFSYLAEHPGIQAPFDKEPHVFDADDWSDAIDPQPRVEAWFAPPDGRLRFEATPVTIYWPHALERVRRYRPDMRLILLFRDPAERAFSQWRMESARGHETEDFGWCIREGRKRFSGAHRVFSYVERGFYGAQLARALDLFPGSQILCLQTRALRDEPNATLDRVARFLALSPFAHVERRTVRPPAPWRADLARRADPEDLAYLREIYQDDQQLFEAQRALCS